MELEELRLLVHRKQSKEAYRRHVLHERVARSS